MLYLRKAPRIQSTSYWPSISIRDGLNRSVRNQQQEGLLDMVMVGQWYTYHAPADIDKTRLKAREEVSDSEFKTDSTDMDEEDEKEPEKVSDALRAKLARMKPVRKKKMPRRRHDMTTYIFVGDEDVMLKAPGLKGLLSYTDSEVGMRESVSVESQPVAASWQVNWDW
ncbi:hypothetical protein DFH07DRAFT_767157 [Mycena maculata]|uniref:Uncharacterized protein n=1 Tax=Mycena maculata TaxID=230809 RepID=A0AAD7K2S5_9AGAR|nr:hypothetical protein DFH07DRAFT_767157 [Mycena maculata]